MIPNLRRREVAAYRLLMKGQTPEQLRYRLLNYRRWKTDALAQIKVVNPAFKLRDLINAYHLLDVVKVLMWAHSSDHWQILEIAYGEFDTARRDIRTNAAIRAGEEADAELTKRIEEAKVRAIDAWAADGH